MKNGKRSLNNSLKNSLLVLVLFLMSIASFASSAGDSAIIKKIEVTNNREVPVQTILSQMGLKEGDTYSTGAMLKDYENIKKLEYIQDVTIRPSVYEGGVKLTVSVVEKEESRDMLDSAGILPLSELGNEDKNLAIGSVEFRGNKYVTKEKLASLVPIKAGNYFSRNRIIEGHRNLIESGLFREVTPEAFKTGNKISVIYHVDENPVLTGVVFSGNTIYTDSDLISVMSTKVGENFNINTIRADRDKILDKYHKDGYALADIVDMGINQNMELEIHLSEGVVRSVEVQKMVVKQRGNRRKPTDTETKTLDYVIEREIEIPEGSVFNSKDFDATSSNLMRLGHFKNVKYEAEDIPGDPDGKNIVLMIDEDRTAMLQGAISYGSEVGFMGSLALKDTNWKGRGQELGISYERSSEDYSSAQINFYDPWIRGTKRVSWGWSAYFNQYEDDDSRLFHNIDTLGTKLTIGKGLTRNLRLSLTGKYEYVQEKAQKGKFTQSGGKYYWDTSATNEVKGINDKYSVVAAIPALTYDTRNHPWNPTKGFYGQLQLEVGNASGYKGGSYNSTTLELRTYHRGFFKRNTFAYRLVGGKMSQDTKETQRFWVGGGNTLRGYDGGFFRGTEKLTGTIENRTQINDVLGFVLFYDAGRAWKNNGRDLEYTRDERFHDKIGTTAGVGLRLNTPVGPLRFDFGWPVGNKFDHGVQFYFNMGHSF